MEKTGRSLWRRYPRLIPSGERPVGGEIAGTGVRLKVADISEGGAELIVAEGTVSHGEAARIRIRLLLPLPEPGHLEFGAQVRHAEAGRLGIAFESMTPAQRDRLARYLDCERRASSLRARLRRWYEALREPAAARVDDAASCRNPAH